MTDEEQLLWFSIIKLVILNCLTSACVMCINVLENLTDVGLDKAGARKGISKKENWDLAKESLKSIGKKYGIVSVEQKLC